MVMNQESKLDCLVIFNHHSISSKSLAAGSVSLTKYGRRRSKGGQPLFAARMVNINILSICFYLLLEPFEKAQFEIRMEDHKRGL
mmetsp:Transcript_11635/g.33488  ORF Transcript_11635/g.33488 Transcript_11635/m.33488 type:complete len:85 (-) Transcript_11635:1485-1739(-)